MAAPVFAPSPATRDALMGHPGISEIFDRAASLDMAIVSVGEIAPHSIFAEYGLLTPEEIASLERAGAVGDVLCHFIDAEGRVIDHPVNDRVLALHPYELRRVRNVVLASGGSWEHIGAQHGLMLFDDDFNPTLNSDAGLKAMEVFLALQKNAIEGVSGAGWGENRAAWLGGQVASDVSWQDSGTQASRPDQSQIVGDSISIFEPRVEGGRFAPTNVAGSTSCVAATSRNPEGAFLMLAFLTTASIMAGTPG